MWAAGIFYRRFMESDVPGILIVFNMSMTQTHADALPHPSFRPWKEGLFVVAASMTILAILLYEANNWTYGDGLVLRLAGIALSVAAGIVFATWSARHPEFGAKRPGAFTLMCAIIALLSSCATYFIGQGIQYVTSVPVVGFCAMLTMTLVVFGAIALVVGIIKRINA